MQSDPNLPRTQKLKGPAGDGQDKRTSTSTLSFLATAASTMVPLVGAVCIVDWIFSMFGVAKYFSHTVFVAALMTSILTVGYFLQFLLDRLVKFFGASTPKRQPTQSRGAKAFKFTVIVVIIPLLVSLAAAALYFPITRFFDGLFSDNDETTALAEIANSVLSSTELKTKEAGIEALGQIDTRESVYELRRILENEKQCFSDWECYSTARNAIVHTHEKSAPEILLAVLELHQDDAKVQDTAKVNLNQRYFQADFTALRNNLELAAKGNKSEEQIATKLGALEGRLTADLSDIEKDLPPAPDNSALTELILDAYKDRAVQRAEEHKSQESPRADAQMLGIARQIADNEAYSGAVRAKAVSLVGAIGHESDIEWLLKWVRGRDEGLRLAGMQAFADLDFRVHHQTD